MTTSTSLRLAAIDIGSNSIHMVIAQADPDGGMLVLWRMKEKVKLGGSAFEAGLLPLDTMNDILAALKRFKHVARQRHCEKILCVATSAVRESKNAGDFLERVKNELDLDARVVTGREEARLIYLGVRHATRLKGKR